MHHHYVPRCYLRQWSTSGDEVVTYVRVGPPANARLRDYRKPTKGICFEPDLHALEAEHRANGLTLQEIEALLGKDVDQE